MCASDQPLNTHLCHELTSTPQSASVSEHQEREQGPENVCILIISTWILQMKPYNPLLSALALTMEFKTGLRI